MKGTLLCVSYAVLDCDGEDSAASCMDEHGAFLCVADGCGGLGSCRYTSLNNHTAAYAASRFLTKEMLQWVRAQNRLPKTRQDGEKLCFELENRLSAGLHSYADLHCAGAVSRIAGSMQRRLPSTLCAAMVQATPDGAEACIVWAGDSRGYVLDPDGLHQCTADDAKGNPDAFESLYRDAPLTRYVCADQPVKLNLCKFRTKSPCVFLCATDGAYNALPTPMEFEMLMLTTLLAAKGWVQWERKLTNAVRKTAQDDATIVLYVCGVEDFESFCEMMKARRTCLQKTLITPVRRRKGNVAYAREKWREYQPDYDWTEDEMHERLDWRL